MWLHKDNSLQLHHAFSICGEFYGFSTVNIISRKKKHNTCCDTRILQKYCGLFNNYYIKKTLFFFLFFFFRKK